MRRPECGDRIWRDKIFMLNISGNNERRNYFKILGVYRSIILKGTLKISHKMLNWDILIEC